MTTLREEIEEHLRFRFYKGNAMPYPDRVTNEIISKIEKRIDEKIQYHNNQELNPNVKYQRLKILEEVKEMLK